MASRAADCNGIESAQREERNISDALRGEIIDEGVIVPACHVIKILDANCLGHGLRLSELFGSNVAQTDVADEPLTLELGEQIGDLP